MVSEKTRNSYSEIWQILKYIDREDVKKIPINVLETIKEYRNEEYIPNINFEDFNNSISRETKALYIWLYLTYITKNLEEKKKINSILYKNDIEKNSNIDINVFKEQKEKIENQQNTDLVVYKPNVFKKIIDKIKNLFCRR